MFNIINELNTFEKVKPTLTKKPYNLQIKYTENLYLVNTNKFINNISKIDDTILLDCNGTILEKNTNKVICKIYPVMKEYPVSYTYDTFSELTCEEAIDGTLIKVFYYNNQWNLATNRCIDAKDSYWISKKSFYDLFMEAANNIDFSQLTETYCYAFILQHPDNRHITKYDKCNIIYLYSYDLVNNCEVNDKTLSLLDKPKQFKFKNWTEFHEQLNTLPYDKEGFILYNKNKQMTKYVNPKFNLVKKLKGNTNDMLYQCIVLHKYGQNTQFLTYYPEYKETFTDIQKSLYKFVNSIYTFYVTKYINKQTVTVNEEIEIILNHLHLDYLNTKIKINKKIIMTKIIGYSPKRIYNLLQPTSK